MRQLTYLILALFVLSCNTKEKAKDTETTNIKNEIALKNFDTEAANFVGEEVLVTGIVDHVCKHGGKKLLLVNNDAQVHITSEKRFSEDLVGSKINLTGVVIEERITEATCLQMEEDNMKSHSEGMSTDEQFQAKKKHIKQYRDQMANSGKDYISNFSLEYVSLKEIEATDENEVDSKVE